MTLVLVDIMDFLHGLFCFNNQKTANRKSNPGAIDSKAQPSKASNASGSKSAQVTDIDRNNQTRRNCHSPQRSTGGEATSPKSKRKPTNSYSGPTHPESGGSSFTRATDLKLSDPGGHLEVSSLPRANSKSSDWGNSGAGRSGNQGQSGEEVEQHLDARRDSALPGQNKNPQTKETLDNVGDYSATNDNKIGPSNSANDGRSRPHRHERATYEDCNGNQHPKSRKKTPDAELTAKITSLEQKTAQLVAEKSELLREAELGRTKLSQHSQARKTLETANEDLQRAQSTLKSTNSQLETNNKKLQAEITDTKNELAAQYAQWKNFHGIEINNLQRQNQENQEKWHKERTSMISSYDKEKRDIVLENRKRERAWNSERTSLTSKHDEQKKDLVSKHRTQEINWSKQTQELRSRHQEEMNKQSEAHQTEMSLKDKKHLGETEQLQQQHASEMEQFGKQHVSEMEQLKRQHAEENKRLKTQIKAKQQQLASYSSNSSYVAISDQQLRASFQNLSQDVSNLTALISKPPNVERATHSDPSGYLMRHVEQIDRSWPRFLRSLCWTVLYEGFFALPLGFGALGNEGEGSEKLGQLRQLFMKQVKGSGSDFSTTGKHANIWRATLFDAILQEVNSTIRSSSERDFAALFHANISQVSGKLFRVLQQFSASEVDRRIGPQIKKICEGLGQLSLQMGTQRAQVFLDIVPYGHLINKPNEMFVDEGNGTGSKIQVDIVTMPCMRRVGDGREDVHTESIILKGSVVSLEVSRAPGKRF